MNWQARHVCKAQSLEIECQDGLVQVKNLAGTAPKAPLLMFRGFVDLQVNGYHQVDMSDSQLSAGDAETFCRELAKLGVVGFLATLTTHSDDHLLAALSNLNKLADESNLFGKMMLGIHLEGPFISAEDGPRGAHPSQFCCPPDIEKFEAFQRAAGGRIRIVTLSPEYPEADDFILEVSSKVIVSIGHTSATPAQIRRAVENGATMSTHLGNGMHKEIVRHPNYLWEQLAEERLHAGLIADGVHLDAAVIKSMIRAKGLDRCFLVSDSTVLSGAKPGLYRDSALGDVEVTSDRRLVIAGQTQLNAGAYRPMMDAVPFLMKTEFLKLNEILQLGSMNPLRILGLDWDLHERFVLFEISDAHQMDIRLTVIDKEPVFVA